MTEIWRGDGQSSSAALDEICDPYYASSPDFQIASGARPAGLSCEAATFIDPMTPLLIIDVFGEPG